MCGRYVLAATLNDISSYFAGKPAHPGLWTWEPNWNLAPGVTAPVIALDGKGIKSVVPMRWGLHPHWKKTPSEDLFKSRPLFNARLETAAEKPSFRTPWRRRRCLVPMSGWYEWEGVERPKTPYYIHPQNDGLSAFLGLWDHYHVDEGITLLTYTILTTAAKGEIKHLHHRMPVRLKQKHWRDWLEPDIDPQKTIAHMLASDDLVWHEVSRAVGSGRAQGPNLILPTVD